MGRWRCMSGMKYAGAEVKIQLIILLCCFFFLFFSISRCCFYYVHATYTAIRLFFCVVSSSSWHHERCVCCVDQRVISAEYFHIASNSRPAPMNHCCSDIMPVTKGHIVTAMDIIAWLHVHDLLAYFCAVAIAVCVARRHHRHLDPIVWCVAFWFATIHFDIGANDDDDVATIWTPSFGYRALHTCLCLHATFSICLQLWYGTLLGMEKREYMRICWNSTSTNK